MPLLLNPYVALWTSALNTVTLLVVLLTLRTMYRVAVIQKLDEMVLVLFRLFWFTCLLVGVGAINTLYLAYWIANTWTP